MSMVRVHEGGQLTGLIVRAARTRFQNMPFLGRVPCCYKGTRARPSRPAQSPEMAYFEMLRPILKGSITVLDIYV